MEWLFKRGCMKLILDRWQGLGDNLQVSTIPRRMFEKYGELCVYISDQNYYRNSEIRKLVWENNPYIAGFTNEPGENMGCHLRYDGIHWIGNWERVYGFEEPYSIRPEIYISNYQEDIFNVSDKVVVDISYSDESYKQNIQNQTKRILNIKSVFDNLNENIFIVNFNNLKNKFSVEFANEIITGKINYIDVNNIFDFCNVIKNCKKFICTHSGCHVLASAIRKDLTCLIPTQYYNMKYFVFPEVEYINI